jgi:hypothetical protein
VKKATVVMTMVMALLISTVGVGLANTGWTANDGTTFDGGMIMLDNRQTVGGTSYEHDQLDIDITDGDTISFEYNVLDGPAACTGDGAPRVFVQGGIYNTHDASMNNGAVCGGHTGDAGVWVTVTTVITGVTDGPAGATGIVNDGASRVIAVRNLVIAGETVFAGDAGYVYGDEDFMINVLADFDLDGTRYAEALDLTWTGPSTVKAGDVHEYQVRLRNTTGLPTKDNVVIEFDWEGPAFDLEYCTDSQYNGQYAQCASDEWLPLTDKSFGPTEGFPVPAGYDATTVLRASFTESGLISGTMSAVGVGGAG